MNDLEKPVKIQCGGDWYIPEKEKYRFALQIIYELLDCSILNIKESLFCYRDRFEDKLKNYDPTKPNTQ